MFVWWWQTQNEEFRIILNIFKTRLLSGWLQQQKQPQQNKC